MVNYETMFVLSVANGEEATAAMVEKVKALVSANGTLNGARESLLTLSTTRQKVTTFS